MIRWGGASTVPHFQDGLQWLMAARLSVLYLLLLIGVLQQIFQSSDGAQSLIIAYTLLATAFAFNTAAAAIRPRNEVGPWQTIAHILFDVGVISVWIHYSAGKEHVYSLLYLTQILCVALILYQRAALFAALAASCAFGIVLLLQGDSGSWAIWAVNVALFLTLGMVGGYLSEELHRTNLRLAEKTEKVDRLIALQERILSHLPTGVLTIDRDGRIGFLNPAASQILGLPSDQAVGRNLSEVAAGLMPFFSQIPEESLASEPLTPDPTDAQTLAAHDVQHRTYFLSSRANRGLSRLQQIVEIEHGTHRKILRGDVAFLEAGVGNLLHGEATEGRVLLFQDVTKLWHLEEKVKQNEKLAAVGQLAAGIAHEIRNPLAGMSASIEMLRSSLPREVVRGEDQKLMDIALREIDRLNQLISEFLDYVKPQKLKTESVDLARHIGDILMSIRQPAKPGKIQSLKGGITVRSDIELKEKFVGQPMALANPEKLKQVIWNLVINAIQAMDKKGAIEVGCDRLAEGRVRFWVQDQGQGMDERTLSHLYEPFFTTKEKGTGLGLATAYKLVEAMHGEIRVESTVGRGTRFEVVLPSAV